MRTSNRKMLIVAALCLLTVGCSAADSEQGGWQGISEPPSTSVVTQASMVHMFSVGNSAASRSAEATTTTSTTTTTTTTTTVPVVDPYRGEEQMCEQWHKVALDAGWDVEHLPRLSYLMWRESRCDPSAWNQDDPTSDGSRGLVQINGYWCRVNRYNPEGFLQTRGVLESCEDLHDPAVNLTAALVIWNYGVDKGRSGWGPWAL